MKICNHDLPVGPIDNKSALVQLILWCLLGTKPLLKQVMTDNADVSEF